MRHPTLHDSWSAPRLLLALVVVLLVTVAPRAADAQALVGRGQRVELAPALAATLVSLSDMTGCASTPDCELKFVDAILQVEIDGKRSSTRVSALGRPPLGIEVATGDHRVTVDDVQIGMDGQIRLHLGVETIARPQLDHWTQMRRRGLPGAVSYANLDTAVERTLPDGQPYQVLDSLFPGGFVDGDWLMVRCRVYDFAGEQVDVHAFCDGIPRRDRLEKLPEPMRGLLRAVDGGSQYRFLLTSGEGVTPKRPLVLELAVLNQFRE